MTKTNLTTESTREGECKCHCHCTIRPCDHTMTREEENCSHCKPTPTNTTWEERFDEEFVFKHTTAIPEFEAWNEPKIKSDSPWIGTSSRYHSIKPDYDFIDLHALARNVANDILFESMGGRSIPLILGKENVN